jgi:hypothetical protein
MVISQRVPGGLGGVDRHSQRSAASRSEWAREQTGNGDLIRRSSRKGLPWSS